MNALEQFIKDMDIKTKAKTKPTKAFAQLPTAEKWAIIEILLRNLGYID